MKSYDEMVSSLFERRERYSAARKRKRALLVRSSACVCCVCFAALTVFAVRHSDFLPHNIPEDGRNEIYSSAGDNSASVNNNSQLEAPENNSKPSIPSDETEVKDNSQIEAPENASKPDTTPDEAEANPEDAVNAVYRLKDVSCGAAKQQFGHSIKECTAPGFVGYSIGCVSQSGNYDGSEKTLCLDAVYRFSNGTVTVTDRDRFPGVIYDGLSDTIEYKGHIFADYSRFAVENQVRYEYFPTQEKGLAYIAVFDKGMGQSDIFDLILSLIAAG